MQYFDCDTEEFACLNPSLSCVEWWIKYEKLCSNLKKAEEERLLIQSTYGANSSFIQLFMKELEETFPDKHHDLKIGDLEALSSEFQKYFFRPSSVRREEVKKNIFLRLLVNYGRIDFKELQNDLEEVFIDKILKSDQSSEQYRACIQRVAAYQGFITKHEKDVPKLFNGGIPLTWRTYQTTEEGMIEFGVLIVSKFIEEWRKRATLFDVPVTINGTAIHTLPTARKEVWKTAFSDLKLSTGRGYQWKISTEKEPEDTVASEFPKQILHMSSEENVDE
jgi:hypothetical protein